MTKKTPLKFQTESNSPKSKLVLDKFYRWKDPESPTGYILETGCIQT